MHVANAPALRRDPGALRATIPLLLSYIPMGAVFGLLFGRLGHPWWFASLSGLFVYAGAAQFLSVGLLAAHAGLVEIFFAAFLLNLRHLFYGFSLLKRYDGTGWRKAYLIHALTDETYALLTSGKSGSTEEDRSYCFRVSLLNHLYWVIGCTLGGWLGSRVHIETAGLEFIMTALFTVLAVEQAYTVKRTFPFFVAAAAAALGILIHKPQMLFISMFFAAVMIGMKYKTEKPAGV